MRRWLTAGLLLLLLPAAALSHGGGRSETVKAGLYAIRVDFPEWPLRAEKTYDIFFTPEGGPEGKAGRIRLVPDPSLVRGPWFGTLRLHSAGRWGIRRAIPVPGVWTLEFEVNGPEGRGVGRTAPFEVGEPSYFPRWLAWLTGLSPLAGLVWFGLRERRRILPLARANPDAWEAGRSRNKETPA